MSQPLAAAGRSHAMTTLQQYRSHCASDTQSTICNVSGAENVGWIGLAVNSGIPRSSRQQAHTAAGHGRHSEYSNVLWHCTVCAVWLVMDTHDNAVYVLSSLPQPQEVHQTLAVGALDQQQAQQVREGTLVASSAVCSSMATNASVAYTSLH
jgi:hypothetical protein